MSSKPSGRLLEGSERPGRWMIEEHGWWRCAIVFVATCFGLSHTPSASAQNGTPRISLATATGATELPVGPWGSYSARHAGPCYLASRRLAPLFAFPIVVGQQRDEVLSIGTRAPDGRTRLLPERVTLLRRAVGLSPSEGARDEI